jgi:hypothetical protein
MKVRVSFWQLNPAGRYISAPYLYYPAMLLHNFFNTGKLHILFFAILPFHPISTVLPNAR